MVMSRFVIFLGIYGYSQDIFGHKSHRSFRKSSVGIICKRTFSTKNGRKKDRDRDNSHCDFDNIDLLNLPLSFSTGLNFGENSEQKKTEYSRGKESVDRGDICNKSLRKPIIQERKYHQHSAGDCFGSEQALSNRYKTSIVEKKESVVYSYQNSITTGYQKDQEITTIPDDDFLVPHYKKKHLRKKATILNCTRDDQLNCRNFPFKPTPSGNLKVESRQVVYETKKFSVLVANPKTTKVSISDNRVQNFRASPSKIDLNTVMKKENKNSTLMSVLRENFGKDESDDEDEFLYEENILEPEKRLEFITNYRANNVVDWDALDIPAKRNLYMELYQRISSFTHTDCKIYIDNEEFSCHLIVLQCYSEYFEDYNGVRKVELRSDQVSAPSFAFIYEWMISGDPSYRELTRENVLDIFSSAKFLKIKDLVEQCWTFIDHEEIFFEITAFVLYTEAKEKGLPEVCDLMLPRIQKFFLMLVSSRDWLDLEIDDVVNLLRSNYILVNCEMEIFMSAVRWLRHDWEGRDCYKYDLMRCIRFGNLAAWQLVDIKRNPDNHDYQKLSRNTEICKMIDDGLANVIIKYWYGHANERESEDYEHWSAILGLKEVEPRNWTHKEKTYLSYREFLIYLDKYRRNETLAMQKRIREECRLGTKQLPSDSGESTGEVRLDKFPFVIEKKVPALREPKVSAQNQGRLSRVEAVRIIERTYLQHKVRKKNRELENIPLNKRNTMQVYERHLRNKKIHVGKLNIPRFNWKSGDGPVYQSSIPRDLPKSPNCVRSDFPRSSRPSSIHKNAKDYYISDESLYCLEHESVVVFGGINVHEKYGVGRNTGKDIYRYLPIKNEWIFVGEMPAPRTHHGIAYLAGRIYIVGGSDPREDDRKGKFIVVDTMWSFDPVKKIWYEERSLNLKRKNFGLVVSGMELFAIGGQDRSSRVTDTVEKYNLLTQSWSFVASMKNPRMGIACTKFEEKIWAGGGMGGSSQTPLSDYVECYDIEHNQWTEVTRLRVPRCFATFFAMSNNLYLIAGAGRIPDVSDNTVSYSSIDIYDKERDIWKEHAEMEVARHGHTTAYLGTQILIIGGVTTVYMRCLSSIECYCTSRGTWIRGMSTLPNALSGHATVTLPPAQLL